jgi:primosomal protein N' (replication factor Y)
LADGLFRWPDFRAPERAYQILKQVAGRAGRGDKPGKVLIQAYTLDHPTLKVLRGEMSEEEFLENEREMRKVLSYSPFGRMARIRFEGISVAEAKEHAEAVASQIRPLQTEGKIDILGPSEAFLERAKGIYRWDILIKATEIGNLQRAVLAAKELCLRQKWSYLVDVDPYGVG